MGSVEWNKKEELVAEQALKHLKVRCTTFCVLAIIVINKYYYTHVLLLWSHVRKFLILLKSLNIY